MKAVIIAVAALLMLRGIAPRWFDRVTERYFNV